jgi:hypothetical protein
MIYLCVGGVLHIVGNLLTNAITLLKTSIEGLHTKLWASKVAKVPILESLKFQLGSPRTK